MAAPTTGDSRLAELSEFVRAQTGLYFPQPAWRDLERGMASAATELGFTDAHSCIRWLLTTPVTPRHIELLARYLTVGETYFFREKPALDALEGRILPELIKARSATTRRLRIWSAACCTGEEPYTIAIILNRLLPDWREWDLSILGTDINPHFLKVAAEGVYRNWSFRATPASIKERYFTPAGDGHAINSDIKQMVTFKQHNLADASYSAVKEDGHDIDIIFCRNTLMYFSTEGVARTVASFHDVLADRGWLVVNPSEASSALFSQYDVISQPDVILFRRGAGGQSKQKIEIRNQKPGNAQSSPTTWVPGNPQLPLPRTYFAPEQTAATAPARQEKRAQGGGWEAAYALHEQGRQIEAREKLLALVEKGTNDTRIFALLASIEANLGQLASALAWSEQTTRSDRMNPAHWYLRATILQEQGDLDEAIAALKRVLYLDPDFVLAHFVLGNMTMQKGRKAEALRHFNIARSQLGKYMQDDILIGSDDLTARQLDAIIAAMLGEK